MTTVKCLLLVLVVLSACSAHSSSPFNKQWSFYLAKFYQHGRIIDTANRGVSHSEGQGYGMLLAVKADDPKHFAELWRWTQKILQRDDHLFYWRYKPCEFKDSRCIDDVNNATDGDILIAWALLRAAKLWDVEVYRQSALAIIMTIREKLIKQVHGRLVLLPGDTGFYYDNGDVQLNLSYWLFPAFKLFAETTQDKVWQELIDAGNQLIELTRFGRWQLPPDWFRLTAKGVNFDNTLSHEYGYNAVRIPLNIVWQGRYDPKLLSPFLVFWDQIKVPDRVDLSNDRSSSVPYSEGMKAIAIVSKNSLSLQPKYTLPRLTKDMDYFSASLIMLSFMAALDLGIES